MEYNSPAWVGKQGSAGANIRDDSSCGASLRNKVLTAFGVRTGRMCHRLPLPRVCLKSRDAIEKALSRTNGQWTTHGVEWSVVSGVSRSSVMERHERHTVWPAACSPYPGLQG